MLKPLYPLIYKDHNQQHDSQSEDHRNPFDSSISVERKLLAKENSDETLENTITSKKTSKIKRKNGKSK